MVKLFAAFAFADKKSLGFDPTVQLDTSNEGQFILTVQPGNDKQRLRRFRTMQIISSGAEPLLGRGTRVFEAVEINENRDPNGSPVVLKDTWVDSDRTREGNVIALLHTEANCEDRKLIERSISLPRSVTETFGRSLIFSTILQTRSCVDWIFPQLTSRVLDCK